MLTLQNKIEGTTKEAKQNARESKNVPKFLMKSVRKWTITSYKFVTLKVGCVVTGYYYKMRVGRRGFCMNMTGHI